TARLVEMARAALRILDQHRGAERHLMASAMGGVRGCGDFARILICLMFPGLAESDSKGEARWRARPEHQVERQRAGRPPTGRRLEWF
ncbi:hypothetical protein, partial [Klebsiella pneumoniae]|uniref:hypothetical protein n=1 Tax=Klebsiella pneumoniae TaxID=573 RepID=UPI0019543E9B